MKRSDLVRSLQVQFKRMRANDADAMLGAVAGEIIDAIIRGDKVEIRGFGTFLPRTRAAKIGYNPRTGQPMKLSAGKTILFKPGKSLVDQMN